MEFLAGVDVRTVLAGALGLLVLTVVGLAFGLVLVAGSAMRALDEERGSGR